MKTIIIKDGKDNLLCARTTKDGPVKLIARFYNDHGFVYEFEQYMVEREMFGKMYIDK